MNKFTKYNSIENVSRSKTINEIIHQGFSGGEWVVTEKIHGSNFSLWDDGQDFNMGKRSGFIKDGNFYNAHTKIVEFQKYTKDVWSILSEKFNDIKDIALFGELYGGHYPHPDVENTSHIKAVQSGVYYRPDLAFYGFDMMVNGELTSDNLMREYLEEANVPHAKVLFRGSFEEAIKFDNIFQTLIPQSLGLPAIEGNNAEGVVIKPVHPAFFGNGSRVILKSRNPTFDDGNNKSKKPKEAIILEGKSKEFFNIMFSFITNSRLDNIVSKLGKITNRDFGKILTAFWMDVLEEFQKDNNFEDIEKKERKIIQKMIGTEISLLIRPRFLDIMDRF